LARIEHLQHLAVEHLDLLLGRGEPALAPGRELGAAPIRRDRRIEAELARFHLPHQRVELVERLFEAELGDRRTILRIRLAHPDPRRCCGAATTKDSILAAGEAIPPLRARLEPSSWPENGLEAAMPYTTLISGAELARHFGAAALPGTDPDGLRL